MFNGDFKEKNEKRVDLSDDDSGALQELLRYMYTGKVNEFSTIAAQLLPVADKASACSGKSVEKRWSLTQVNRQSRSFN